MSPRKLPSSFSRSFHVHTLTRLGLPLLLSLVAASIAQAASPVEVLVQGTAHQALFAVDFEGANGLAVGAAGEVQSTSDSGKTWVASKLPTDLTLLSVHTDATRSLAVGQSGTVFLRAAGGEWEKIDAGTTKRLFSVSANATGLAAAAGEFGGLLLSEDGGRTWHTLTLDWAALGTEGGAEPHLYGVTVEADGSIMAVGEFGMILRSADRGRSWALASRATASLFAIEMREDGVGYAVGQDGYAVKTTDHGNTWLCIDLGSKAILTGVASSSDGRVSVSAMREMLVSSNDGSSWGRVESPEVTTLWYVGVAIPGTGGSLLVGQTGRIVKVGT